jgi:hypothetical protein
MKTALVFFVVMLGCLSSLWAASGDWVSPTVCSADADWDGCDSTFASDDERNSNAGTNQHFIYDSTFNFSAPGDATLDSLIGRAEGYSDASQVARRRFTLQWVVGGSAVGDAITITMNLGVGSEAFIEARGTTDAVWGTGMTIAQLNDAGTGLRVQKTSSNAAEIWCDAVQVQAWWTEAGVSGVSNYVHSVEGAGVIQSAEGVSNAQGPE